MREKFCTVCEKPIRDWDIDDEEGRCTPCHHDAHNEYQCEECGEYVQSYELSLTDNGSLCPDCLYVFEEEEGEEE